ncbi:hypothetical protein J5N97_030216 [Dioscorea zingiberensis]|uniref:DUF7851 domain-containing protein n=1 Tax=Dioscorea zingiberensis TaxID=325984 RepID=A0A9D5H3X4_9LILI|nr:hypothetical protein J5N97_030216 [Dioscorea zingiberensis]
MMEEDKEKKNKNKKKKQKQKQVGNNNKGSEEEAGHQYHHFKCSSEVKGIRFGGQFIVKSFTVRRATSIELRSLLSCPQLPNSSLFLSTIAYIPTNFTILAHHAWHTLTLGLGTKKSKVVIFVFETESLKMSVERQWPGVVALGDVNKRMIRGLSGCEMARFKFRKGSLTFYVYAIRRRLDSYGIFSKADDLRCILESLVALNDFLDHTAMLALPSQQTITNFSSPVAVAH